MTVFFSAFLYAPLLHQLIGNNPPWRQLRPGYNPLPKITPEGNRPTLVYYVRVRNMG